MRLATLAVLPFAPAALGCAGTISGPEGVDAEATTTTTAIVAVERTADSSEGSRAEASARFIRVTAAAPAADAPRTIGAALDLPARGSCATIASLGASPAVQAPVVELVDVGAVSVVAEGVETRLAPRQLPDVTDVVSGVVYARATDPTLLPASAPYVFRIAGTPGLGPLEVATTAPADPGEIRVAGEETPGLLVASSAAVDLSWNADRADDLVYVDVRPNGVRCVLDGSGRGSVSTMFLDDAGTLVVHRLRREPLRARGIDAGEIRFDFARALAYVRR
jgi:hypothetical protein